MVGRRPARPSPHWRTSYRPRRTGTRLAGTSIWSPCAYATRSSVGNMCSPSTSTVHLVVATAWRHTLRRRKTHSGWSAPTPRSRASISMWTRARLRSESRYPTHRPRRTLFSLATQVSNSPKKAVRVANVRCCCCFKLRRWPWGRQTATANGTVHSRWRSDCLIERVVGGTGLEPVTSCL